MIYFNVNLLTILCILIQKGFAPREYDNMPRLRRPTNEEEKESMWFYHIIIIITNLVLIKTDVIYICFT